MLTLESLNNHRANMVGHLDIIFTELEPTHLCASMPVDERTKQPFGLLHGGASVVLAETLGSVGALYHINPKTHYPVGLEINANHIKSATKGRVYGKAEPVHIGRSTHIWSITIKNEEDQLVCTSRMTVAILEKKD